MKPAALLLGRREYLPHRLPEPERAIADGQHWGLSLVNSTNPGLIFTVRGADLTGPALLFVGETAAFSAAQLDVRAEVAA